jgi:hypothetical protein
LLLGLAQSFVEVRNKCPQPGLLLCQRLFSSNGASLRLADDDTSALARRWSYASVIYPQFALSGISAIIGANRSQQVADNYAGLLEQNMISFSATAFDPISVISGQTRR